MVHDYMFNSRADLAKRKKMIGENKHIVVIFLLSICASSMLYMRMYTFSLIN